MHLLESRHLMVFLEMTRAVSTDRFRGATFDARLHLEIRFFFFFKDELIGALLENEMRILIFVSLNLSYLLLKL